MRDANNTPNQSVAADVSRLKLDPRPARNGRLHNKSDPAHAGCYKREWKSTRATGEGAIAGSTIGVAFKPMLNRYLSPRRGSLPTSPAAGPCVVCAGRPLLWCPDGTIENSPAF